MLGLQKIYDTFPKSMQDQFNMIKLTLHNEIESASENMDPEISDVLLNEIEHLRNIGMPVVM
jgi:hypothetical protein